MGAQHIAGFGAREADSLLDPWRWNRSCAISRTREASVAKALISKHFIRLSNPTRARPGFAGHVSGKL